MKVLNPIELNNILIIFLKKVELYNPYMYAYFHTMYLIGARFQDVYHFDNWNLINDNTVTLQPHKKNKLRVFNSDDIDNLLFLALKNNFDFSYQISYSSCLRFQNRALSIQNLKIKSKPAVTHLFRHNKAKQLKLLGYTDEEIKEYLGQNNIKSTNAYIYSEIYTD